MLSFLFSSSSSASSSSLIAINYINHGDDPQKFDYAVWKFLGWRIRIWTWYGRRSSHSRCTRVFSFISAILHGMWKAFTGSEIFSKRKSYLLLEYVISLWFAPWKNPVLSAVWETSDKNRISSHTMSSNSLLPLLPIQANRLCPWAHDPDAMHHARSPQLGPILFWIFCCFRLAQLHPVQTWWISFFDFDSDFEDNKKQQRS